MSTARTGDLNHDKGLAKPYESIAATDIAVPIDNSQVKLRHDIESNNSRTW